MVRPAFPRNDAESEDSGLPPSPSTSSTVDSVANPEYTISGSDEEYADDSFGDGLVSEPGVSATRPLVDYQSSPEPEQEAWWADDQPQPDPSSSERSLPERVEVSQPAPAQAQLQAVPGPSTREGLWYPPPGWVEAAKGELWCPASGRLVKTAKMSRHLKGEGAEGKARCKAGALCPLRHFSDLTTYHAPNATQVCRCTCGATIRAGKRGLRAAAYDHLKKASSHKAAAPSEREELAAAILSSMWRTVSRDSTRRSGLPVLGNPVDVSSAPAPPPTAGDGKLTASVAAVGNVSPSWVPEHVMTRHRHYVLALRRLVQAADVVAPDWRYIVGSHTNSEKVRSVLAHELTTRPRTGNHLAHATLRFTMFVRGRLATVGDRLEDAWSAAIGRFQDMVRCELKEHSDDLATHKASRYAERQETPMDVVAELRRRNDLLEAAHDWTAVFMADPDLRRLALLTSGR